MLSLRKGKGALLLVTLTLAAMMAPRQINAQQLYVKKVPNWIDWNIMFEPGTDSIKQQSVIHEITSQIAAFSKDTIAGFNRTEGKITALQVWYNSCICSRDCCPI